MTHKDIFFAINCDQFVTHYEFQFLMQGGCHDPRRMDPWTSQQAAIGWIDVHHLKSDVKGVWTYLD
ncbi:hypothetical protein A2U01_0060363, partial [Trifolium medium]|nr:hypothetical protein [Trifolium medium]